MTSSGIRIVVINGSARPNNYTSMASALVVDELKEGSASHRRGRQPRRAEPAIARRGPEFAGHPQIAGASSRSYWRGLGYARVPRQHFERD